MLRKVVAYIVAASLIILGLMFSVFLIAFLVVVGVTAWGYIWWKTRLLRKQLRNRPTAVFERYEDEKFKGEIIEGEVIREEITRIER